MGVERRVGGEGKGREGSSMWWAHLIIMALGDTPL